MSSLRAVRLNATTTNPGRRRWLALVFIAVAQLMIALDATIVSIALPSAQAALGASDTDRQWVVSAYTLAFGALLLPGGRLADRLGRRRAFLVGLVGFALASLAGGAAPSFGALIAARALQGAFAALLAPSALALLSITFTERRDRATAFAVYGSIAGSGAAIGMLLGGALTQYLSWRWCLYVNLPIALAAAGGGLALVTADRGHAPAALDLSGVLLDRNRAATYAVVGLAIAGMFGAYLFLTYYLQAVLRFTPLQAGAGFLPITVASQAGSWLVARRLSGRVRPGALIAAGTATAALGLLLLTTLSPGSGYLFPALPAEVLLGVGISTAMVPAFSTATLGVDPRQAGVAAALVNSSQQLGASLGTALLNGVATSATAASAGFHAQAVVHGFAEASWLAAGLMLAAALVARVAINAPRPKPSGTM